MTTEFTYERAWLEGLKERLGDGDHLPGCPAPPDRISAEVVQGPPEDVEVDTGRLHEGRRVTRTTQMSGPYYTQVRCVQCGAEKVDPLDDADELTRRAIGAKA